jgi:hypothetical protein
MYDGDSPGCCDCTNGDVWKEDWYVLVPWLNTQYVTINILSMVKLLKLSLALFFSFSCYFATYSKCWALFIVLTPSLNMNLSMKNMYWEVTRVRICK